MPKNPHAQALGSLGGKKAAARMTPEERTARAKKASLAAAEARKRKAGDNPSPTPPQEVSLTP